MSVNFQESVQSWMGLEIDMLVLSKESKDILIARPEFRREQYPDDPQWLRYASIGDLWRQKREAQAKIGEAIGAMLDGKFYPLPDGRALVSVQDPEYGDWEVLIKEPLIL